jgi:hypothetical protein
MLSIEEAVRREDKAGIRMKAQDAGQKIPSSVTQPSAGSLRPTQLHPGEKSGRRRARAGEGTSESVSQGFAGQITAKRRAI